MSQRMRVLFKSGETIEVDATSASVSRSRISGETMGISWETPADWKDKLLYVKLDDISAVVMVRDDHA